MTARLCCSYLRAYKPLSSLSESEKLLVEQRGTPRRSGASVLELIDPQESFELYEKCIDGEPFFCPTHPRMRWLLAMVGCERSLPDGALSAFFSPQDLTHAREELEELQRAHPDVRPAMVQSLWHVPPRWFVCFDDAERRVEQTGDHPTIRYETTIEAAHQRVGRALETLTGGIVHPAIVGMIYELREWLSSFGGRTVLELDYASVATLFDGDDLADDHSAADIWAAIVALGEGDGMRAALNYRRVNERWALARRRVSLN